MQGFVRLFLNQPAMPPLEIPLLLRSARMPIEKAIELFYWRGVLDGFLVGAVLATILLLRRGPSRD